jgi:hypothetical protein
VNVTPTHKYAWKTMKELLKTKQERFKNAPFDEGSPSREPAASHEHNA